MVSSSPALAAARALAIRTGSPVRAMAETLPAACDGAVLLLNTPSDTQLAEIAAALPRLTAAVFWSEGWDEGHAVEALGRHGIEHGSVALTPGPEPGALCAVAATEAGAEQVAAALQTDARALSALAIVPVFNEADIIDASISALVSEGVDVYLIDHCSTDETAAAAAVWLGKGLVHIERFPDDAGYAERNSHEMVWRDILRRVQEVSEEVVADWYIFHNADEFREAPFPGLSLTEGLREVDELGYSAVNFELYDFRPVDEGFLPGHDPRTHLRHYEAGGRHDALQVKAWKRQAGPVDLVTHGGHNIQFAGRRIFPVPFLLRHYPLRSGEHGRRKVLAERLPRFAAEERAANWHVQYDRYAAGAQFLHDPAALAVWDGVAVRAELLARTVRELLLSMCVGGAEVGAELPLSSLNGWLSRRGTGGHAGVPLQSLEQRLAAAAGGVELVPAAELDMAARDLALALEAHARVGGDLVKAIRLSDARRALPVRS